MRWCAQTIECFTSNKKTREDIFNTIIHSRDSQVHILHNQKSVWNLWMFDYTLHRGQVITKLHLSPPRDDGPLT
jgi:hypothetical protein